MPGWTLLMMLRLVALVLSVILAGCSAAPIAAPSASASPIVALPSPSRTPVATTAIPTPTASRTPIPLPNEAAIDAPSGPTVWVLVGAQSQGARLFRSTDRGDTWDERSLPAFAPIVFSFIDAREGWAMIPQAQGVPPPVGGQCGSPVTLAHTTDGGATWQSIVPAGLDPPGPCKTTLRFADPQRGFIGAYAPTGAPLVYRTSDGGRTWTPSSQLADPPGFTTRLPQGQVLSIGKLAVFGSTLLLTASQTNPFTGTTYIYRSTDGGVTWAYASTAPNSTQDIAFPTAGRWLQIASAGDARETTDGGGSWHPFTTTYQQAAPIGPALSFGDAQVGYATARGAIQRTIDGGAHWTSIKTPGTF